MPSLTLESVEHIYRQGKVRALDGVSLHVEAGERVALIGQNGSGKTTLVRHLNGLLRPSSGRVLLDGADVAQRTVAQLARTVGLVFQDPETQIFAGSVRAEVEFGPRNVGMRGAALRQAVDGALAHAEVLQRRAGHRRRVVRGRSGVDGARNVFPCQPVRVSIFRRVVRAPQAGGDDERKGPDSVDRAPASRCGEGGGNANHSPF